MGHRQGLLYNPYRRLLRAANLEHGQSTTHGGYKTYGGWNYYGGWNCESGWGWGTVRDSFTTHIGVFSERLTWNMVNQPPTEGIRPTVGGTTTVGGTAKAGGDGAPSGTPLQPISASSQSG